MSWDAIIGKTSDPNFAKPADNAPFVAMGKPKEVKAKLNMSLPGIDWSSTSEGHVYAGAVSLEFSLTGKSAAAATGITPPRLMESEDVEFIGVSARGSGAPIPILVSIAKANQWSIADSQDGTWIDLNAPSEKSWVQFTEFRDKIVANPGSGNSNTNPSVGTNLLISAVVFVAIALAIKFFLK